VAISSEDFAIWQAQPITQAVMKYFEARRDDLREGWLAHSWGAGNCDPVVLAEARGGAAMANDILELGAGDLNEDKE
jgi:N-acetylglucosamine kinase-like BadF-type ATPase